MPQTVPHRRPNSAYPFLGEFRMRSVLAPSFFTFKYPGVPFLLALGFHIVLSAISFAEAPRITVYSSGRWCKYCNSLKNDLKTSGTVPRNFNFSGPTKIDGVDVEFVNLPRDSANWPQDVKGVPAMRVGNDPVEGVNATSLKTKIKEIKNSEPKEETDEDDENSDADPDGHSDYQDGDQTPTPTGEGGEPKPEPKPAPPPPPAPAPPAPPAPDGGGGGNGLGQMLSQALQGLLQGGGQGSEQQFNQQEEQFANDNIMEMVYGTQTAVSLKTAQALATEDALSEISSEEQTDDTSNQASSDTESADVALTPTALPTPASTVDPMIEIL